MNIKYQILFSVVLVILGANLYSQDAVTEYPETKSGEFTEFEWKKIQKRWDKYQPRANVILLTGDTITGQLIYANENKVILYPSDKIMLNTDQFADLIYVPIKDIDEIFLMKGGPVSTGLITGIIIGGGTGFLIGVLIGQGWTILPAILLSTGGAAGGAWLGSKVQRSVRTSTLKMDKDGSDYKRKNAKLQRSAVYRDSLTYYQDIYQMIDHSKAMRRCFPKKHFRVSFGISMGFNTTKDDLTEMLESTTLPPMDEFRHGPLAFEFYDFSWRFASRYIAGVSMFLNKGSYTYLFHSDYSNNGSSHYSYDIQVFGAQIYGDYVIKPVNRFFTKPIEFTAGVGILLGSPVITFNYGYYFDNDEFYYRYNENHNIFGVQLRAAFYYYPFPGFSVSIGLQGNIYENVIIPAMILPTHDPAVSVDIPEHKLHFSSLRVKSGISIYF